MNTAWSNMVQSTSCLYTSRRLRFADRFKDQYTRIFDISHDAKILEIGCGPGALCESLVRWYPMASVYGIDLDSNFIEFAKRNISGPIFSEADATDLPFASDSFDVTVSNTVSEHIAPDAFFGGQYRVLKNGGICLLLSSRRGIEHIAPCVAAETEFEQELWGRVDARLREINRQMSVRAYPMTERELPIAMEKYGFHSVSVNYIIAHMTPDDPSYDADSARFIIESERATGLNPVNYLKNAAPELVSDAELEKLTAIINKKYDDRLALYDKGEKQWDTYVSITMIVRGIK